MVGSACRKWPEKVLHALRNILKRRELDVGIPCRKYLKFFLRNDVISEIFAKFAVPKIGPYLYR